MTDRDDVELLNHGEAFADLSDWRKIAVSGADALTWLNDLVTADLSDLAPGRARGALLLSPTGRVRAQFTVAMPDGSVLLLQDPAQPEPIDGLLARYVLSSDVQLGDRTADLALLAFPGREVPPDAPGAAVSAPSVLGSGLDVISGAEDHARLASVLSKVYRRVDDEALERWRVSAGRSRFGVDGRGEDLPVEAGLDEMVTYGKGCFLGQEAVAKVRTLGHPRRLIVPLEANGVVAAGDAVVVDGAEVGRLTSATSNSERTLALARVGWDARIGPFRTSAGTELLVRA